MAKHKNDREQPLKLKGSFEGVISAFMTDADRRTKQGSNSDKDKFAYLEMTPIIAYDEKTSNFFAYYKEFPRASAVAASEQEVIENLQSIFQVMLKEHNEEITEEAKKMLVLK